MRQVATVRLEPSHPCYDPPSRAVNYFSVVVVAGDVAVGVGQFAPAR